MKTKELQYHAAEGIVEKNEFLQKVSQLMPQFPTMKKRVYNPDKEISETIEYYNIPAAFDIETTSFYQDGVQDHEHKRAIMYWWTFGIWNVVTYGRTWDEFLILLDLLRFKLALTKEKILVVYVHNLPFEFYFMRKRLEWDKVFLLEAKKPVYAISNGFEFRDMLKLAGGRKLAKVAEDLQNYKTVKMEGDLDYSLIRTPLTPLSPKEKKYCENDVRVCLYYIQEKIEQDKGIVNIPLTNTGYVRRQCRTACFDKYGKYKRYISRLIMTPNEYFQLQDGFQGGFTHANSHYVKRGQEVEIHDVASSDLTSAYPTEMLLNQFPATMAEKLHKTFPVDELQGYLSEYCCLFDLTIEDVEPRLGQEHAISYSKCRNVIGATVDNGRIVTADRLTITVTEQDYFIYDEFYKWGEEQIDNMRIYRKDYLPKPFTDAILDLYRKKTELKGITGKEVEYMISKNMINSGYGMMVTNPVRPRLDFINGEFAKPVNPSSFNEDEIITLINKYNSSKKRFLFYPWGVWVTAYCRAALFSAIIELGKDYVYADTDSVKYINREKHLDYFKRYNQEIENKIEEVAYIRGQDSSLYRPKNKKGKVCTLGLWDYEGTYDTFKTLGAKRYLVSIKSDKYYDELEVDKDGYTCFHDKKYKLTVAGTNKVKSCNYLVSTGKPFESFDSGLCIPAESSGRNVITFINEETDGYVVDYLGVEYHYHELSGAYLSEADYNLSISPAFESYLKGVEVYDE